MVFIVYVFIITSHLDLAQYSQLITRHSSLCHVLLTAATVIGLWFKICGYPKGKDDSHNKFMFKYILKSCLFTTSD